MRAKKIVKAPRPVRKVEWIHRPDPAAEQEFWRLYFSLSLDLLVQEPKDKENRPGRQLPQD